MLPRLDSNSCTEVTVSLQPCENLQQQARATITDSRECFQLVLNALALYIDASEQSPPSEFDLGNNNKRRVWELLYLEEVPGGTDWYLWWPTLSRPTVMSDPSLLLAGPQGVYWMREFGPRSGKYSSTWWNPPLLLLHHCSLCGGMVLGCVPAAG